MKSQDDQDDALSSEGGGQRGGEQEPRSESEELPPSQRQDEDRLGDSNAEESGQHEETANSYRGMGESEVDQQDPAEPEDGSTRDRSNVEAVTDELSPEYAAPSSTENLGAEAEEQQQTPADLDERDHTQHVEGDTLDAETESMNADQLRYLVSQMRHDHENQLQAEERARSEVEEMCLRIEKHFKAEKVIYCLQCV